MHKIIAIGTVILVALLVLLIINILLKIEAVRTNAEVLIYRLKRAIIPAVIILIIIIAIFAK